jgi:4-aminobutyrate aminotransferase/(S)-3-amino-2-methylpropionate transaminase
VSQLLPSILVPPPGPKTRAIAARLAARECPAFDARRARRAEESGTGQEPIVYAHAHGSNVWDPDENRYVDLVQGFGALALGHRSEPATTALSAQGHELVLALGDVYGSAPKAELMEALCELHPTRGARVLLGLSGADAVTAALKTAALATGRPGVVAFGGAYHGLSHGPLAACGLHPSFREPFSTQIGTPVVFVPYPRFDAELDACRARVVAALARADVGAVLVEPVLGRGGVVLPPASFLPMLREACDAAGALLVVDEIWTGLGRSGAWLASVDDGVVPDLVCVGKALGGGLPVSACIGTAAAMDAWGAHGGTVLHTATHFGWPLACATATATLEALRTRELPARAKRVGAEWLRELRERTLAWGVKEVRGRGLMVGVELEGGSARALRVARKLLEQGWIVLTGGADGATLTLTPALDVDEALLSAFAVTLSEVLEHD